MKNARTIIDEALTSEDPGLALEEIRTSGQLAIVIPEIDEIVALSDDPVSALHKDVWQHTREVVRGVPNVLELRWSALLHDIAKARTRRVSRVGRVTFHGHEHVGARMVDSIQDRSGLFTGDEALLSTVRLLVLNHLRPASYSRSWPDSAVRRLVTDLGGRDGFDRLMLLSRADLTTKRPEKRPRCVKKGDELEARVAQVLSKDALPRLPKGTMGIILERSGVAPGSWLSHLRDDLETRLASGALAIGLTPEEYAEIGLQTLEPPRSKIVEF